MELEGRVVGRATGPCCAHDCFLATVMWFRGGEGSAEVLVVTIDGDEDDEDVWKTLSVFTGTSAGNTHSY